jgi:hypothetical protein
MPARTRKLYDADRGYLQAGKTDFKAAWQGVVAQARKAEEARGRELAGIYTGDRQMVVIHHDALTAPKPANRPHRYIRRAGRVSRLGGNPKPSRPRPTRYPPRRCGASSPRSPSGR